MSANIKVHSLLTVVLAALLFLFFNAAKQSSANPFTEDPYDAVGSFAIQVAPALALFSVWRAFRPRRGRPSSAPERVLSARTQLLVALTVLITLTADVVAILREPRAWASTAGAPVVATAILGLACLAAVLAIFILRTVDASMVVHGRGLWLRTTLVCLAAAVLLAAYPARWASSIVGTLLAVIVGALALFAPMANLSMALLPADAPTEVEEVAAVPWRVIFAMGGLIGLLLALAESQEGGGAPEVARVGLVVTIFVGLEVMGLLMAFLFLRRPLGLRSRGAPTESHETPL